MSEYQKLTKAANPVCYFPDANFQAIIFPSGEWVCSADLYKPKSNNGGVLLVFGTMDNLDDDIEMLDKLLNGDADG